MYVGSDLNTVSSWYAQQKSNNGKTPASAEKTFYTAETPKVYQIFTTDNMLWTGGNEAAVKAAAQADADRKVTAASSAACKAATGEFVGIAEETADDSADYEKNWTKNLKTDDQTVLRTAKAAQDMEKMAMSKLQEIQLMDHAAKGISQSENVTEYVSVEEDENEEKIWTVTSFGEDGIISTRCQNGKVLDSWNIKYDNPEDAKKVWDYLAKFKNDDELEFAGSKDFWMEFLSDDMAREF